MAVFAKPIPGPPLISHLSNNMCGTWQVGKLNEGTAPKLSPHSFFHEILATFVPAGRSAREHISTGTNTPWTISRREGNDNQ